MMVVPKLDADGGLQLFPVDLSITPNRVFPTRCMAHDRDFLTKECLDSLTANHGVAGYDGSSAIFFRFWLFLLLCHTFFTYFAKFVLLKNLSTSLYGSLNVTH